MSRDSDEERKRANREAEALRKAAEDQRRRDAELAKKKRGEDDAAQRERERQAKAEEKKVKDEAQERKRAEEKARKEDWQRQRAEAKARRELETPPLTRYKVYILATVVIAGLVLLALGALMHFELVPWLSGPIGSLVSGIAPPMSAAQGAKIVGDIVLGVGAGVLISGAVALYQSLVGLKKFFASAFGGVGAPKTFPVPKFVREPLVNQLTVGVSDQMISAGFVVNPVVYVGRYVVYAVETGVISLPLSALLFYFTAEPLWFLINLVPLALLAYPHLEVSSRLNTTTAGVENELPYFSVFASVMQSAGVSLYNAFERVVGSGIFRWMEQEGQLIQKERVFFGKTEGQALQERSRHIQSDRFRVFIQGYTSVLASGGDLSGYLEGKVKEFIQWSEFTWKKYAGDSSDIGEVIISMFFVLPLLIISVAFVYPEATMDVLGLMVILVLPLLTGVAWLVVDRAQPHSGDMVTGDLRVSAGAGVGVAVVTLLLAEPYWIVAAATLLTFSALYGWSTYFQLRDVRQSEAALPQFLRDITEYKKIGYDITKAIQKLAGERSYNPAFDFVLIDTARQLELGARLKDVGLKTRSWFTKMAFKTLGEIVDSGGGTPELMELVTEFTQRISVAKKETRAQLRLYGILTYATPIGLALVILLMQYMMSQFSGAIGGEGVPFISGFVTPPPIFVDMSLLLIIEASAMAAFIASKAVDFTSKATLRVTSVTAVGVISIVLCQYALSVLSGMSLI